MKCRPVLLGSLLLFLAGNIASCKNKLPVDGALEIGFPFRFIYYVYTNRDTGFYFNIETLGADIAIASGVAWCAVWGYNYLRKRIKSV